MGHINRALRVVRCAVSAEQLLAGTVERAEQGVAGSITSAVDEAISPESAGAIGLIVLPLRSSPNELIFRTADGNAVPLEVL